MLRSSAIKRKYNLCRFMDIRQRQSLEFRSLPNAYYHLCTDGWHGGKLFYTREQYASGMTSVALLCLKYGVRIYAFELMPNHLHIVISGTGAQCLDCFYFMRKRINKELRKAGNPVLPADYWMKIVPVPDRDSMRRVLAYLARNRYETGQCTPCGHIWGTGYLLYNQTADYIVGIPVKNMKVRALERLAGTRMTLPSDWEIHPDLGVLPRSFVQIGKNQELFPSVKDYMTALVKDYESYVRIADSLGETITWSESEAEEIVGRICQRMFPQREYYQLSADEKCLLLVQADSQYHLQVPLLSKILRLPEHLIRQVLYSKDYGQRRIRDAGMSPEPELR